MLVFTFASFAPCAVIIAPSILGFITLWVIGVLVPFLSSYITSFFVVLSFTVLVPPPESVSSVVLVLESSSYIGIIWLVCEYVINTFVLPTPFIFDNIFSNFCSIPFSSVAVVCVSFSVVASFLFVSVVILSFFLFPLQI